MCYFLNQCKVNGFSMEKFIIHSLIYIVVISLSSTPTSSSITSSSSSLSSLSSSLSATSTVKSTESELVSSESKDNEDKNDLLKDLKDFGPDDLAKLIKAKKEKDLDEFKTKVNNNLRGNQQTLDNYQSQLIQREKQKVTPIVQQHEDDYQGQGDLVDEDGFDNENDAPSPGSEKGSKKSKHGPLGALLPFLPNPGSVMTMMVKPIDHPEQMVCDCYNTGKTSPQQPPTQQQQLQITQQQVWPPMVGGRKVPMLPPMAPIAPIQPPMNLFPPSPFAFIGQHFANKPRPSNKKKPLNPFSLLLMGLTGNKRKRPRPRPVYPNYSSFQQHAISPILPGIDVNEADFYYPSQQIYNTKGGGGGGSGGTKGGRKGRKRQRNPSHKNLPPPPSAVKGRTKGKTSDNNSKWHWTSDDYKDLQQGFNEAK